VSYFDSLFIPDRVDEQIRAVPTRTDRVIIHAAAGGGPGKWLFTLGLYRAELGFRVERSLTFGAAHVIVWQR
jgi:hypothetical protein